MMSKDENVKCDHKCNACIKSPCPEIANDWGVLQGLLDQIGDINAKVSFLQTLVSANQFVCYNAKCPVFEDIQELRTQIADFDLPITSISDITQLKGINELKRKIMLEKYQRAKLKCDKALQKIMTVASVNKALNDKEEGSHKRRLELIDKLNQSHLPLPIDVKSDIEQVLNTRLSQEQWEKAQGTIRKDKLTPKGDTK